MMIECYLTFGLGFEPGAFVFRHGGIKKALKKILCSSLKLR